MILFKTIKNLSQKRFIRDVSILQFCSFFSLGISALTSIIFARLLGSDNYGLYALIFSFVSLTEIFMDLGADYTALTLLPAAYARKDRVEIKNILSYFFYISLFISLTIGVLILLISPLLTDWLYHQEGIGRLARYVILAVMVRTLFFILTLTLQSIRKIKSLTVIENLNKFTYLLFPVSLVLLGYGLFGIVFGHFISALIFSIVSLFLFHYLTKNNELLPSMIEIIKNFKKINFKKYLQFGFLVSLNKNLDKLYAGLPLIFLGMFTSAVSQIAYFKIATGYLSLPIVFLTAISRVLMVQLSQSLAYGGKIFKENFKKAAWGSGLLFIFLLIPFIIFASFLISLLYGEEYLPAIKLVYILSLGFLMSGFSVGYSAFFRILDKMKVLLFLNLAVILSGVLLFFIFLNFISPLESAVMLFIYFGSGEKIIRSLFIVRHLKRIKD